MSYSYKKDEKSKHIFLIITALVCFILASSVLPFMKSAKSAYPVPDIMLCFVCALVSFTDIKKAGIYALSLGFLADLFVNPPSNLSPLVYLGCAVVAMLCQRHFSRVGTLAIAISVIPCSLIKQLVIIAVSALTLDGRGAAVAALPLIPQGLIIDFACAIVTAFVMRVVCRKLRLG